jgi:hypothetical protein
MLTLLGAHPIFHISRIRVKHAVGHYTGRPVAATVNLSKPCFKVQGEDHLVGGTSSSYDAKRIK